MKLKKEKLKKRCCERYLKKPSACKTCPMIAPVPAGKRKKKIKKLRKVAG